MWKGPESFNDICAEIPLNIERVSSRQPVNSQWVIGMLGSFQNGDQVRFNRHDDRKVEMYGVVPVNNTQLIMFGIPGWVGPGNNTVQVVRFDQSGKTIIKRSNEVTLSVGETSFSRKIQSISPSTIKQGNTQTVQVQGDFLAGDQVYLNGAHQKTSPDTIRKIKNRNERVGGLKFTISDKTKSGKYSISVKPWDGKETLKSSLKVEVLHEPYLKGTVIFKVLTCVDMTDLEDCTDEPFVVFNVILDGLPLWQRATNAYENTFDHDGAFVNLSLNEQKVFVGKGDSAIPVEKSLTIWAGAYESDLDTSYYDDYKNYLNDTSDLVKDSLAALGPEYTAALEFVKMTYTFVFDLLTDDPSIDSIGQAEHIWSYDTLRKIAERKHDNMEYGTFDLDSGFDEYGHYQLSYVLTFNAYKFGVPQKAK